VILFLFGLVTFVMAGALAASVAIAAASLVLLMLLLALRGVWRLFRPAPVSVPITFDSLRLTSPVREPSWPKLVSAFFEGVVSK
jgi:hypothetical protein